MKVTSRCLSHLRLDQTYCLLNARSVGVVLELFKAIDIRGEMALDGKAVQFTCPLSIVSLCTFRHPVPCLHACGNRPQQGQDLCSV